MIYSGSIITITENTIGKVKKILKNNFKQIEIHTISDDERTIVISIEANTSREIESLTANLMSFEEIVDVGHSNFFFEEEVEKMTSGEANSFAESFKSLIKSER